MRAFTGETFSQLFDRGDQLRLQGLNLSGCAFINCGLSLTEDIAQIAEIQDIQISDCTVSGCSVGPLVASDVTISDLSTDGLLILWNPYLRHVEMKGKMGRIKINATARPSTFENEKQKPFDDYRSGFYADVDWALDISKARFKEFDIDG